MNYKTDIIKRILENEMRGLSLENQIILIIFETLLVFIPGIILFFKKKITIKRLLLVYLTVLYAGVILSFTIFRRPIGSRAGILHMDINLGFDSKGLNSEWNAIFSTLNILLFVPWGMLLYFFIKNKSVLVRIIKTTLLSFVSSVCIEVIQIITATGMFEVSDIVTNTMGGFIGCIIMAVLFLIHNTFLRVETLEEK